MFIKNLISDFYRVIQNQRLLVLASPDVDAICACKIVQQLLKSDNIPYTLVPVAGITELKEAYRKHGEQVKYVILLNCGGTLDIVEFFEPAEDVIFFIADSHRPLDVYNIYNEKQVIFLTQPSETEGIPSYEDVFREESDDEDEEENNVNIEERLEKRMLKRQWVERRNKILFDYSEFSYYSSSIAVLMFELMWKLSRDTNETLWLAIVGLTDLYVNGKVEKNKYVLEAGTLQGHVSRHNHRQESEDLAVVVNSMKIIFDKELQLVLYRHWSIFESFQHTMHSACKFKLWTSKGQKKLLEFLAELGLPLVQCKQKFSSMDAHLKANVKTWIEEMTEKYGLDQMVYGSFLAQYGYRRKFSATDVVLAVGSLLESWNKEKSASEKFLDALQCLSRNNIDILEKGIDQAKDHLRAICRQVQTLINMNQVILVGPFLYATIQDGSSDANCLSSPSTLLVFARFLLNAHVSVSKNKRARNLPLVLTSPYVEDEDFCFVLGIPPVSEDSMKNFFAKAFEQVGENTNIALNPNFFDSSVILIRKEDKTKFFDSLISLLS